MKKLPREIWMIILEIKNKQFNRNLFLESKKKLEYNLIFPNLSCHEFRYDTELWYFRVGCHYWFITEQNNHVTRNYYCYIGVY